MLSFLVGCLLEWRMATDNRNCMTLSAPSCLSSCRRLSDREYWNLRREENEARKKEMLRKGREQEEAKRRRILEALQRTEEKAAEARLERSREAMRLKREKAERAAAARERVKHAERKEEERLRRMVRTYSSPWDPFVDRSTVDSFHAASYPPPCLLWHCRKNNDTGGQDGGKDEPRD